MASCGRCSYTAGPGRPGIGRRPALGGTDQRVRWAAGTDSDRCPRPAPQGAGATADWVDGPASGNSLPRRQAASLFVHSPFTQRPRDVGEDQRWRSWQRCRDGPVKRRSQATTSHRRRICAGDETEERPRPAASSQALGLPPQLHTEGESRPVTGEERPRAATSSQALGLPPQLYTEGESRPVTGEERPRAATSSQALGCAPQSLAPKAIFSAGD